MNLLYSAQALVHNSVEFLSKVVTVSRELGIQPDWLMAVMRQESGINPKAVNAQPGDSTSPLMRTSKRATGLIQFMPDTAKSLGTTTYDLYHMTGVEQLDYVKKYFWPYRKSIARPEDLYIVTFYPAALGKDDSYKIGGATVAAQNKGFDLDKNGQITLGEFRRYIRQNTFRDVLEKKNYI